MRGSGQALRRASEGRPRSGFGRVPRVAETPFNLVLELRP